MATEPEVRAFLGRFHKAMAAHGLTIWPTKKNNEFLVETGFTNPEIEALIGDLKPQEYSAGPEPDDNATRPPGEVWKFYREHAGWELYVKLKLHNAAPVAECMSCHEADGHMQRPNRRVRK